MTIHEKMSSLKSILSGMGSTVFAYSGGTDSSFLIHVAAEMRNRNVLAVTAVSPTYTGRERNEAISFTAREGIAHEIIETDEAHDERYASNPKDRCFWCKSELFSRLDKIRMERGFRWIADGTNASDFSDYRPGMRAARDFGVRSPLAEAGLTKEEIRALSRERGLVTADRPAQPCLASRIPYGTRITEERLLMVERAEETLTLMGFPLCRVRYHETIARIELPPEYFHRLTESPARESIIGELKKIGFTYVTVDIEGYRMGSMNEVIGK